MYPKWSSNAAQCLKKCIVNKSVIPREGQIHMCKGRLWKLRRRSEGYRVT